MTHFGDITKIRGADVPPVCFCAAVGLREGFCASNYPRFK